MLKVGTKVKDFALKDANGKTHQLSDYLGKVVVVYIYPKNNTPGCNAQACGFNDALSEYKVHDIILLGISRDDENSHAKFKLRFSLSFPTLSDPTMATIKYFGAGGEKKFFGKIFRSVKRKTYIINKDGLLVHIMDQVNAKDNAQDVLEVIKRLEL